MTLSLHTFRAFSVQSPVLFLIVRINGSYQQLSTRRDYNDVVCQPHRLRYVIGTLAADVIDLVGEALAARFRVVGQQAAEIGENDVVGLCGGELDGNLVRDRVQNEPAEARVRVVSGVELDLVQVVHDVIVGTAGRRQVAEVAAVQLQPLEAGVPHRRHYDVVNRPAVDFFVGKVADDDVLVLF